MKPSQFYIISALIISLSSVFGQGSIFTPNTEEKASETRLREHRLGGDAVSPAPPITLAIPSTSQTYFGAPDVIDEEDDEPVYVNHEYIPLDISSKPRVIPTTLYSRIIGSVQCTLNSVFSGTWLNPQCGPSDEPVFYLDQQLHERGKALPRGVLGWSRGSGLPRPRRRYPASPLIKNTISSEKQAIPPFLATQPPSEAILKKGLARHKNTTRKRIGLNQKMRKVIYRRV